MKIKKKQCYLCHKSFPMEHFERRVTRSGKEKYFCKVNIEKYKDLNGKKPSKDRLYPKPPKEEIDLKSKNLHIYSKYGIDFEKYLSLLSLQDYKCKICGCSFEKSRNYFNIDHDHQTGKVRGLLCGSCNRGLGLFKDNLSIIINAINYLENYK